MTDITETPVFKLGFKFARRLAEQGFRDRLRNAGGGTDDVAMLPAVYDEPVKDVVARMTHHQKGLIAIEDDTEPEGVKLIWWEKR